MFLTPIRPLPPDHRFAPPSERRPPNELRVAVQSISPGDPAESAAGGQRAGGSAFVKRLAGSFQRLHGAYVSLEGAPPGGGLPTGRNVSSRPAHPVLLPPLQHPMMVTAQEALQPVLSVYRKLLRHS